VANAQFRKADSLRQLIAAHRADDTAKVIWLLQLAGKFEQINADTVYRNASKAMALSQKLRYDRGIGRSYEMLGVVLDMRGKYDSAISLYKNALAIARASHFTGLASSGYNHIGNAFFVTTKYLEASLYYDSSLQAAKAIKDSSAEGAAYGNIANIYYKTGNYSGALNFYIKSLRIQEAMHVSGSIASDLASIANIYYRIGQFSKAFEYLGRALEINRKIGNTEHIIACLTTYAVIYNDRKMYDSTLHYLEQAKKLADDMQDPFTQNILKGNMAEAYLKKGDVDKAYKLYDESLVMSQKLGDAEGKAIAQSGLGEILLTRHEPAKGISYLSEALKAMRQLGIKEQVIDIAEKLEGYYEEKKEYRNALYFDKIKDSYSDSIKTEKTQQEAGQLMFGYELQKKEDKIRLLEKDNAVAQSQNQTQRTLMTALIAGLLLTVTIAYQFFRNVRNEKKTNELIVKQNEEIEAQTQKLLELNEFKDNTFSVLSHDLRGPVNALTSTMLLLDEKIMSPEEFSLHKQELNNKLQTVSLLLDNLLLWAKSQMKGDNIPDIERINIKRATLKSIAILKDMAAQKSINITNTVDENLWAYGDKNEVDIVIRNLLSNAVKFTPEKGEITISAITNKEKAEISIADNGIGMTNEQSKQLFSGRANTTTEGTEGERGTGLGLKLCYDIIKKNAGDITVSSVKGAGSTFTVVLPTAV
jgi:signal transduction histidine kinase